MTRSDYVQDCREKVQDLLAGRKVLINYLRDEEGNPTGVLVGTPHGLGLSLCAPRDRKKWNKYIGIMSAYKRAKTVYVDATLVDRSHSRAQEVSNAEASMVGRASRYFGVAPETFYHF